MPNGLERKQSMKSLSCHLPPGQQPLRAIIEISIAGELCIYPLSQSEDDERRILEALRLIREGQ